MVGGGLVAEDLLPCWRSGNAGRNDVLRIDHWPCLAQRVEWHLRDVTGDGSARRSGAVRALAGLVADENIVDRRTRAEPRRRGAETREEVLSSY